MTPFMSHISVLLIYSNHKTIWTIQPSLSSIFLLYVISGFTHLFVFPVMHKIPNFAFFKFLILSSETCQLDHDCVIQYNLNFNIITAKTRKWALRLNFNQELCFISIFLNPLNLLIWLFMTKSYQISSVFSRTGVDSTEE